MLRRLSLRRGVWFSSLTTVERGIMNLTIRLLDRTRSQLLFKALRQVIAKLSHALKAGYLYRFEVVGRPLAEGLSRVAYSWGNRNALLWIDDLTFIRCLGMNTLSSGFRP